MCCSASPSGVCGQLPSGAQRLQVEEFEVNRRAVAFYEREGCRQLQTDRDPSKPENSDRLAGVRLDAGWAGTATGGFLG